MCSFGTKKTRKYLITLKFTVGFPDSSVGKESACNAGDPGSTNGLGCKEVSAPFLAQLRPCGGHRPLTAFDPADSLFCLGTCEEAFPRRDGRGWPPRAQREDQAESPGFLAVRPGLVPTCWFIGSAGVVTKIEIPNKRSLNSNLGMMCLWAESLPGG